MIKNTHKVITDYAEAYKQALAVHSQAVAYIKANYKEGSEMYKSAMKTAKNTLQEAVAPMKEASLQRINAEFDAVKNSIRQAVVTLPTAEVLAIIPMIKEGKMTDTECQMFLDAVHRNYMDDKLLHDAMGKHFTTVESVMDDISNVENSVKKFFATYAGEDIGRISYMNAVMLNGAPIAELDTITDEFLTTYSGQASDK